MKLYVDDNRDTFPPAALSQFDKTIRLNSGDPDIYYGNFPGGKDGLPGWGIPATNRLLNPYVPAPEAWRCPADRGIFDLPSPRVSTLSATATASTGTCRTITGTDNPPRVEDPVYNLGLKKESWVPDPARFILMHEFAAFPWNSNGEINITQWHGASNPGKMFTSKHDQRRPRQARRSYSLCGRPQSAVRFHGDHQKESASRLEPGKDWMWYKPLK